MIDQPVAALFPEKRRDAVDDIPAGAVRRLDEECDAFGSSLHAKPAPSKDIEAGTVEPEWRWKKPSTARDSWPFVAPYPRDGSLGKAQNCRTLEESAQPAVWSEQHGMAESVAVTSLR